jgi:hypothetical protein
MSFQRRVRMSSLGEAKTRPRATGEEFFGAHHLYQLPVTIFLFFVTNRYQWHRGYKPFHCSVCFSSWYAEWTISAWLSQNTGDYVQVLQGSHRKVWTTLSQSTKLGRYSSNFGPKRSDRILWDAWKHQLLALGMEEFPIRLAGESAAWFLKQCQIMTYGFACFIRHGGISQGHQRVVSLSGVS